MGLLKAEVKENNVVSKSNDLIQNKYHMTVNEQKFFMMLISLIDKDDKELSEIRMTTRQINDVFNIKRKFTFNEIRSIYEELTDRVIVLKDKDGNPTATRWLSSISYLQDGSGIIARFDEVMKPYLIELKRCYTTYKLKYILRLKSIYAIRIYELLKQHQNFKQRTFEIDELREILDLGDKYSLYKNFKKRILADSIEQINEHTDIIVGLEEVEKIGRTITKIRLTITQKNKPLQQEEKVDVDNSVFNANIQALSQIIQPQLPEKDIVSILSKANNDLALVVQKYYLIKDNASIDNLTGLLIAAIKNEYSEPIKVRNKKDNPHKTKFHFENDRGSQYTAEQIEMMVGNKMGKPENVDVDEILGRYKGKYK